MLNPLVFFSRPEYLLRPSQALRRLMRIGKAIPSLATVRLPWGSMISVHPNENIGCNIYHYGIFDKIVPETIWRLLSNGDTCLEIGANIGQNCLLMAAKVGKTGHVLAFEPHPEIFTELKENCARAQKSDFVSIQLENVALGKTPGVSTLVTTQEFLTNRGSASLQTNSTENLGVKVTVRQLDDFLIGNSFAHVCKIDVEGHELGVLEGATKSLSRKAIRNIIFEDFNVQPSPVVEFLQQYGFAIFELHETWLKPRLSPLQTSNSPVRPAFSYNYLATLDVDRAKKCFRSPGWHCLLNI